MIAEKGGERSHNVLVGTHGYKKFDLETEQAWKKIRWKAATVKLLPFPPSFFLVFVPIQPWGMQQRQTHRLECSRPSGTLVDVTICLLKNTENKIESEFMHNESFSPHSFIHSFIHPFID